MEGQCVLLATDTVYGLAAVPGTSGFEQVFKLKRRDRAQAVAWLVGSAQDLDLYGVDIAPWARSLAQGFWPGGVTLVVKASSRALSYGCVADDGTVALRMPDEPFALRLLAGLDAPLACTSANLHGYPSPALLADVDASMLALPHDPAIPAACKGGVASTIVDCTCAEGGPRILRDGAVSAMQLQELLGDAVPVR